MEPVAASSTDNVLLAGEGMDINTRWFRKPSRNSLGMARAIRIEKSRNSQ